MVEVKLKLFTFWFCRDVRETWIRAKYIDKAFVARPKLGSDASGKKHVRKWSVRKPHRRQRKYETARTNGKTSEGASSPAEHKDSDSGEQKANDDTNSETESFQSLQSKETSSASDQEGVLVFGSDLPPSHTDIVPSEIGYEDESADEPDLREIGKLNCLSTFIFLFEFLRKLIFFLQNCRRINGHARCEHASV